jgi:predicted Zn-dependent peptidase
MTLALPERPSPGAQKAFVPPVPIVRSLPSGIPVWILPEPSLPLASIRVVVWGGSMEDPSGRAGLAALTDELLVHGAGERDARAFASLAERLAIDIGTSTHSSASTVGLDLHAEHLETGLDLLADAILRPRFDKAELELVRDQIIGSIQQGQDEPETIAAWVAMREFWGEGHPLAHPVDGTEHEVSKLTRRSVVASWRKRYRGDRVCIVAAGAVDPDEIVAHLTRRFGAWERRRTRRKKVPPPPARIRLDCVLVDHPDATQSVIAVVLPGVPAPDPRMQPLMLGVTALGGIFTSRLNRLMREKKGYTYGAKAWLDAGYACGTIEAKASVKRESTGEALLDLFGELRRIQGGIEPAEIDKARGARRTSVVEGLATRSGIASIHAALFEDGRAPDALREGMARLEAASLDAVNRELRAIDPDRGVVVVVGDVKAIRAEVEQALPAEWRTVSLPGA